jgi:hypothetical protein
LPAEAFVWRGWEAPRDPSVEVLRMPASVRSLERVAARSLREGGECRDGSESRKRLWRGEEVAGKVW